MLLVESILSLYKDELGKIISILHELGYKALDRI